MENIKNIIIAEKPSMGKNIAKGLGVNKSKKGYMVNDSGDTIITWCIGHLISLKNPSDIDEKYKKWSLDHLPIFLDLDDYYYINEKTKDQFLVLKNLFVNGYKNKEKFNIYYAGDPDREGELIVRLVITKLEELFEKNNKDFNDIVANKYRMWLKDFSKTSITKEFNEKKSITNYDNLYHCAKARQHSDWLVGMNLTSYYTLASGTYGNVLNVGRVQSSLLKLVVERELEIQNFKEEIYYKALGEFTGSKGDIHFNTEWYSEKTKDGKIKTQQNYNLVKEHLEKSNREYKIIEKKKTTKKETLVGSYTLNEIQVDAEKKFKYEPSKTLNILQSLYEKHKITSYPRTDSGYLADDDFEKVKKAIKILEDNNMYSDSLQEKFLHLGKTVKPSKNFVDTKKVGAHSGLYILENDDSKNFGLVEAIFRLNEEEKNIFELILKRLLALMSGDYIYESSELVANSEDKIHFFKTKGKIVKDLGWKELYSGDNKKNTDIHLPNVEKGDIINLEKVLKKEIKTKKPSRYSKGSLSNTVNNLSLLVKDNKELYERIRKISPKGDRQLGLGTPGTRGAIIDGLEKNNFFIINKGKISPTNKAFKLAAIVNEIFIDPITTAEWEDNLKKIEEGDFTYKEFITGLKENINTVIKEKKLVGNNNIQFAPINKGSISICPICHVGEVKEWNKAYSCSSKKCDFVIWKEFLKKPITLEDAKNLLNGKEIEKKDLYSKNKNKNFDAKLKLDEKTGKIKLKF